MTASAVLGIVATWLDWDVITFRNWPHVTWQNDLGLFVLLMASAMLTTETRPKRGKVNIEKRDPRRDPKEGDILEKKYQGQYFESRGYNEREVDEVYDDCPTQPCPMNRRVVYVGPNVCAPDITIKAWRRWAKDAKVVKHAD